MGLAIDRAAPRLVELLFSVGVLCRFLRPISRSETVPAERPPERERWRIEALLSLALVLWTASFLGVQSLLMPVKVVSDGPIYHLYFAARWWKAGRLVPGGRPVRRERRDLLPGQRRPLVHLADGDAGAATAWPRSARPPSCSSRPWRRMAWRGCAGAAGIRPHRGLLFVTSTAFLLFSFEANVDTIFVACYLVAAYFILRFAR